MLKVFNWFAAASRVRMFGTSASCVTEFQSRPFDCCRDESRPTSSLHHGEVLREVATHEHEDPPNGQSLSNVAEHVVQFLDQELVPHRRFIEHDETQRAHQLADDVISRDGERRRLLDIE